MTVTSSPHSATPSSKQDYVRGDVKFPSIECVPFTHTIHGNFCHPKPGLAKTSEIHSTVLRTVI